MNKPTKPSEALPSSFGGTKTNFSASKIQNGYEPNVKDILGGANLNYLLDTLGKKEAYYDSIVDYINSIPINKTPIVNANNQLVYTRVGLRVYDASEVYFLNDVVVGTVNNVTGFYKSVANNHVGQSLSDTNYWEKFAQVENYNSYFNIGEPQFSLDFENLPEDCIWLEGAAVSRTTYSTLFGIYGTTYGEGDGSTTFNLPDFRNRVLWGATSGGYIAAGLPNVAGAVGHEAIVNNPTGPFFYTGGIGGRNYNNGPYTSGYVSFDASRSSSIYGNSNTVQPPSIKVRVYTRYQ